MSNLATEVRDDVWCAIRWDVGNKVLRDISWLIVNDVRSDVWSEIISELIDENQNTGD